MAARILVADDSVTIQKVVELAFSKEDFVLVQARSGEEAIRKAKEVRPDLALLDLVMPDKNGYEVCAALRAEPMLRTMPIILLAGTFEAFDKSKGIQAGANDFVTKPFESQVLISKVKQLLFSKTVNMVPTAAPAGPGKAAPPKEVPRPAPTTAAPPPPGISPRPSPAPGLPRGETPGIRHNAPPPAPTPPLGAMVGPPGSSGTLASSPAVPAPGTAGPPTAASSAPAPTTVGLPPESPGPPPPSVSPRKARTLDLSPPSEEISQDRVRSVVEPPSRLTPSPAPGGIGALSLEDLATLPLQEKPGQPGDLHLELEKAASGPAPVPEELSLGTPSFVPEPDQKGKTASPPETAAFPKDLALEDLLSAEATAVPLETKPALAPLGDLPGEPIFDLTSEMGGPSLPLVEVGTGEPPTLFIEHLLASAEASPSPLPKVAGLEASVQGPDTPEELAGGPVFDLTTAQETPPPLLNEAREEEPRGLSVGDLSPRQEIAPAEDGMLGVQELEFELTLGPPAEAPTTEPTPIAAPPLDLEARVEAPVSRGEGVKLTDVLSEDEVPGPPPVVPPVVAGMPLPSKAEVLVTEMAAMRQEVTERVAQGLARDLSDKLLERIERVVWEVVPDLAEILITKEIERIRSQAEDKQSS